jgi:hypothetical protein
MPQHVLPAPARTAGRIFGWILGVVALLAVVAAGWIGVRGILAANHLLAAQALVEDIATDLDNLADAEAVTAQLTEHSGSARELTGDPVWRAASGLPWVGPQLAAVASVAAGVDDIATGTVAPLAASADGLTADAFLPADGRIDTAAFASFAQPAAQAAENTAQVLADVEAIDRAPLAAPLAEIVAEFEQLVGDAATTTDSIARAAILLPPMLGADGPREHLLITQNNAEWRSLGGIAGATSVIRTDAGAITFADHLSTGDYASYPTSVLDLGDYGPIYSQKPGRFIHNVTQVPDFALTGALAAELASREGVEVSSVISTDPVALSYLLAATGPVQLPSGDTLTADNAVQLLLNEVYLRYEDPQVQDAFFASAAAAVFEALTTGAADPTALLGALARAGDEHRLLLWSADDAEQALLAETTLAGAPPGSDASVARLGVYLNDGTGSKMDFYMTPDVALTWSGCAAGPRTLDVKVILHNAAPADAATALPAYITGDGAFGVEAGLVRTVGEVYIPEGFEVVSSSNSNGTGFGGGLVVGRQVLSYTLDTSPGETGEILISLRTTTDVPRAEAWVTPTADAALFPVVQAVCE